MAYLLGDVNNDGQIDSADMQLVAQHILGIWTLTGDAFTAADVNADGKVDSADRQLMAQYIAGTITHFPGGEPTIEDMLFGSLHSNYSDISDYNVDYSGYGVPPISVHPDMSWGSTLSFLHKGKGGLVFVGTGFAYGKSTYHNSPFTFAMNLITLVDSPNWTAHSLPIWRPVGPYVELNRLVDCYRFITKLQPQVYVEPPDDYGVNTWDDDIYIVKVDIPVPTNSEFKDLYAIYV